jgi:hypothetical protein
MRRLQYAWRRTFSSYKFLDSEWAGIYSVFVGSHAPAWRSCLPVGMNTRGKHLLRKQQITATIRLTSEKACFQGPQPRGAPAGEQQ